ncbi:hypothetical protein PMZ80_005542 [Knufia obscura]|uniref:NAD(P)-binding protein n=2 Tax=Knufia TaxID=430999 RepID=A0AAN8EMF0_9EURO|nr:hypothetical protein PMZ80_005542 [Knufia obscura]KAK5950011.1 hypothetical protein OHC33_008972 [Knufia fluminis]
MANPKPYTVLVTGAASGIGRCFTQHYLSQSNTIVIAADINEINISTPSSRPDGQENELIKIQIDMSSTISIEEEVRNLKSYWTIPPLDLIIHSAGIRGLVPAVESSQPNNPVAAETLQTMTAETMLRTYQINTLGTFTLLQSLANHDLFHLPDSTNASPTKVIIMSSRMGSLSYNTAGGGYAYRASKAALNAIVRSMSLDLRHVIFALVHPGRVETGLTMCREEGAIEVEESVGDMLKVIDGLEWKDSGRFMDRWGVDIGW